MFAWLRIHFPRVHELFASRKLKMASSVRATAVAKRTALFCDFGVGSTLGATHLIFSLPLECFDAPCDGRINLAAFIHRYLANGRICRPEKI